MFILNRGELRWSILLKDISVMQIEPLIVSFVELYIVICHVIILVVFTVQCLPFVAGHFNKSIMCLERSKSHRYCWKITFTFSINQLLSH